MNDETNFFQSLQALQFFISPPHSCSYLKNKEAITLFVDPEISMDMATYQLLSQVGFRRSGEFVYRPHCSDCQACIPVRIPVNRFKPNRSQRRTWQKNQDLTITQRKAEFVEQHFELYRHYMRSRHPGGGMDNEDPEAYQRVIASDWSDSLLLEFSLEDKLLAVAVVDYSQDSLSAVYTFFDPDEEKRSLGVFAILSQIEVVRESRRKWLFLGYWNPLSAKMAYKRDYQPLEYFDGQNWLNQPPSL